MKSVGNPVEAAAAHILVEAAVAHTPAEEVAVRNLAEEALDRNQAAAADRSRIVRVVGRMAAVHNLAVALPVEPVERSHMVVLGAETERWRSRLCYRRMSRWHQ